MIHFSSEAQVGKKVPTFVKCAAENIIPSTVELGGKSPNIFFSDVMEKDDSYLDKAIEGALRIRGPSAE